MLTKGQIVTYGQILTQRQNPKVVLTLGGATNGGLADTPRGWVLKCSWDGWVVVGKGGVSLFKGLVESFVLRGDREICFFCGFLSHW